MCPAAAPSSRQTAHKRFAIAFATAVAIELGMPAATFDPCGKTNAAATARRISKRLARGIDRLSSDGEHVFDRIRFVLDGVSGERSWLLVSPRCWPIELPSVRPTLLVGLNECILLSLAMVGRAGLVGAGGLGAEVTHGLTRRKGLGLRAGLPIAAVALLLDRMSAGALGSSWRGV